MARKRRIYAIGSGLISVLAIGVIIFSDTVSALSTVFFDNNDVTGGTNIILITGNDQYIEHATSRARAYFTGNMGRVAISGSNWCSGGWDWYQSGMGAVIRPDGVTITRFNLTDGYGPHNYNGIKTTVGMDASCGTINYSSNSLLYDTDSGYWYIDIDIDAAINTYGYQNGFKITASNIGVSNAVVVAQAGGTTGYDVTIQTTALNPAYLNYSGKFGTDCTLTTPGTRTINMYDLDNQDGGSGAQVGRDITVRLYERHRVGVGWSSWVPVLVWGPSNPVGYVFTPTGGNSTTIGMNFTATPGSSYRFDMNDVYHNNVIQYSTPFDGVYYDIPCNGSASWVISGASTISATTVIPGNTVTWMHRLNKTGNQSAPISYDIQQSNVTSGSPPSFSNLANGSWTPNSSGNDNVSYNRSFTATLADVGRTICQRIAWHPTSYNNSGTSRTADTTCVTVVTQPLVSVRGNDLRVGSSFVGGLNLLSRVRGTVSAIAGSNSEYGILAPGSVANFGSQFNALGGSGLPQSAWSKLTFANSGLPASCVPAYGCYTSPGGMGSIPNVRNFVNTATYNGLPLNYNRGGTSFNSSAIPAFVPGANMGNFNLSVAVTTTGTITIDNDIIYSSGFRSTPNDIPQLILIANNFNIRGNVGRIDAWLVATGSINTCSDVAQTSLRTTNCNNRLLINGPVMASQLMLNRTYYNTSNASQSAEDINLRGDTYIWANNLAKQNGTWHTVYTTDLPPRY